MFYDTKATDTYEKLTPLHAHNFLGNLVPTQSLHHIRTEEIFSSEGGEKPFIEHASNSNLESFFRHSARIWAEGTSHLSSITAKKRHPAYTQILSFGEAALPLILEDLSLDDRLHWYIALKEISGEDPVRLEQRGNIPEMRRIWLEWGKSKGLIG